RGSFQDQGAQALREESLLHGMVEKAEQAVKISLAVENADWLAVQLELGPGQYFAKFVEGAKTARHGDKTIGKIGHQGFALMHRFDKMSLGQPGMSHFTLGQKLGNNADYFATGFQSRVGDHSHHSDITASVNQCQSPVGNYPSQFTRCLLVCNIVTGGSAAKY